MRMRDADAGIDADAGCGNRTADCGKNCHFGLFLQVKVGGENGWIMAGLVM